METFFLKLSKGNRGCRDKQHISILVQNMSFHAQSCISDTGFPPAIPGNNVARFFDGAASDSAQSLTACRDTYQHSTG